jgi:uncharacterized LabA/DUF88 family protein
MKIVALIDGTATYAVTKALGLTVDYKRLLEWLEEDGGGMLVGAYYFTLAEGEDTYSSIRPLLDWLKFNGFILVTRPPKSREESRHKGSMQVELTVTALELAQSVDHVYLFTGDGEYVALIQALQRRGIRVTVVSSIVPEPNPISNSLRAAANEFVDLDEIADDIVKQGS